VSLGGGRHKNTCTGPHPKEHHAREILRNMQCNGYRGCRGHTYEGSLINHGVTHFFIGTPGSTFISISSQDERGFFFAGMVGSKVRDVKFMSPLEAETFNGRPLSLALSRTEARARLFGDNSEPYTLGSMLLGTVARKGFREARTRFLGDDGAASMLGVLICGTVARNAFCEWLIAGFLDASREFWSTLDAASELFTLNAGGKQNEGFSLIPTGVPGIVSNEVPLKNLAPCLFLEVDETYMHSFSSILPLSIRAASVFRLMCNTCISSSAYESEFAPSDEQEVSASDLQDGAAVLNSSAQSWSSTVFFVV